MRKLDTDVHVVHNWEQTADSNQEGSLCNQYFNLETSDSGGGTYWVISTERWAVDDIDAVKDLFGQIILCMERYENNKNSL